MKICSKCKVEKTKASFSVDKRANDGLQYSCKQCQSDWRKLNIEACLKRDAKYRKLNKEKNNITIREWNLKKNYGISSDDYSKMLNEQQHSCACCGTHISTLKRRLAVDHDHNTGSVRGLLCTNCNIGIGMFKDSINKLQQAIDYLREHYAKFD